MALALSACGGDELKNPAPNPMSFLPPSPQPVAVADAGVNEVVIDTPKPLPTKYDDALSLGRELVKKGDREGAKEMFEAAIKLDKKKAEPHMELARVYIDENQKGLAIAAANKAVKLAPNSSVAWNTKGRAELNRFAYDNAIEAFTKAVELNRDNVWAWNNLGFTELQLKKYDDAAVHLSEATTRPGTTGYMWNNLGIALEQLDRLDEARHAFEEGSKLGSSEAVASRKRLEGVDSIASAKDETKATSEVKGGYEINEGTTDEDQKPDSSDTETK